MNTSVAPALVVYANSFSSSRPGSTQSSCPAATIRPVHEEQDIHRWYERWFFFVFLKHDKRMSGSAAEAATAADYDATTTSNDLAKRKAVNRLWLIFGTACCLSLLAVLVGISLLTLAYKDHQSTLAAATATLDDGNGNEDDAMILLQRDPQKATQKWIELRNQLLLGSSSSIASKSYVSNGSDTLYDDAALLFLATSYPSSPQAQALNWLTLQELAREQEKGESDRIVDAPPIMQDTSSTSDSDLSLSSSQSLPSSPSSVGPSGPNEYSALPLEQRYALAVLYYHWSGHLWNLYPTDGWLITEKESSKKLQQQNETEQGDGSDSPFRDNLEGPMATKASSLANEDDNLTHLLADIPINECFWLGVQCNTDQTAVTRLNFTAPQFSGYFRKTMLPRELGLLTSLELLEISVQGLIGRVPSTWKSLTNLKHIDLTYNQLSGFESLSSSALSPGNNSSANTNTDSQHILSGWTHLEVLFLDFNNFKTLPLSALTQMTDLLKINLSDNRDLVITDDDQNNSNTSFQRFPFWDSLNSWPNLIYLKTKYTKIPTRIPDDIGFLTNLENLQVDGTPLYGSIPTTIGLLSELKGLSLYLPSNYDGSTDGNRASVGALPTEIGRCTSLQYLGLAGTGLTGTLPSELQFLSDLEILNFHYNHELRGTIPTEMGLMSSLITFQIPQTSISGTVPSELANAASLVDFQLQDTDLTGLVPIELCDRIWDLLEADCSMIPGVTARLQCDCCTQCFGP